MSSSAAAFAAFPSEARGALLADTHRPLSLFGTQVHAILSSHAAQLRLRLHYLNETNRQVRVIAAYPVPPQFQLQRTLLVTPGRPPIVSASFQPSSRGTNRVTGHTLPRPSDSTAAVATQSVPFPLGPGERIMMEAVYHVSLEAVQRRGEVALTLPTALFPALVRPPEVQRDYGRASSSVAEAVAEASGGAETSESETWRGPLWSLAITVDAHLYSPLRRHVQVIKGDIELPISATERGTSQDTPIASTGTNGDASVVAEELTVRYVGDTGFHLVYTGPLPTKPFSQQPFTVRAPIHSVSEPLRLHWDAAAHPGEAAVALTLAPALGSCPVNAELFFVIEAHSVAVADLAAGAIERALAAKQFPDTVYVNALLCSEANRKGYTVLFPTGSVPVGECLSTCALADAALAALPSAATQRRSTLSLTPIRSPQLANALRDAMGVRSGMTTLRPMEGYARHIVVLSDAGSLASMAENATLVCDVATHAQSSRLHCLFLGAAAESAAVLESLAHSTGGCYRRPLTSATTLASMEAVLPALTDLLEAACVPCLTQIRVGWHIAAPESVPVRVLLANAVEGTDIHCTSQDTQRLLYAIICTPSLGDGDGINSAAPRLEVQVVGRVGKLTIAFTVDVVLQPSVAAAPTHASPACTPAEGLSLLYTAAAAARIQFLSAQERVLASSEEQEVVDLSTTATLPSPYTVLGDKTSSVGHAVFAPSVRPRAQAEVALVTRRSEVAALAALSWSQRNV